MECDSSQAYKEWATSTSLGSLSLNAATTQPNGCKPTQSDSKCSGSALSTFSTSLASSTPMITTYVIFGGILVALILFLALNAATIQKAKAKSAKGLDAHVNFGLTYK